MWNSGSDVISRSSAVELHPVREPLAGHGVGAVGLHDQLRPPGRARGRDQHRQVVRADVGRAASAASDRSAASRRPARRCRAPRSRAAGRRPASTSGRSSASVTRSRGRTWPTSPASSSGVPAGSVGTVTAPSDGQRQPAQQVRRGGPRRDHDEVAVADARVRAAARPAGRPAPAAPREGQRARRRCAARRRPGRAPPLRPAAPGWCPRRPAARRSVCRDLPWGEPEQAEGVGQRVVPCPSPGRRPRGGQGRQCDQPTVVSSRLHHGRSCRRVLLAPQAGDQERHSDDDEGAAADQTGDLRGSPSTGTRSARLPSTSTPASRRRS